MNSDSTVDQSLRLRFFRRRRPASIAEVGSQVWQFLHDLASLHPAWKQWSTRDAGFQPQRVRSATECARYLSGAEIDLLPGNRPSHRLVFSSAGSREQSCDLRVLFALQDGPARWNLGLRLEMRVGSAIRALGSSGAVLIREMALAAVKAFHPHAGFAGTMVNPSPRWDESREPEAAWITYLSRAANGEPLGEQFPDPKRAPPPDVSPSAMVTPVLELGWIIVAFPEIMTPDDAAQLEAVTRVQRALGGRVRQDTFEAVAATLAVVVTSNPAYLGEHSSSDGPSPWAKRLKSNLAGTSLAVEIPRAAALPFTSTGSPAEALDRAVLAAEQARGPKPAAPAARLDATTDMLDLSAILQALPFAKDASHSGAAPAPPPAAPFAPGLTLEQHASMCVEIALSPARVAETLARYRITPQEKVLIDRHYRDRVAASAEVRAAWERSYQSYQVWLQSNQGRTR
jgi:hypothetical protein